MEVQVCVGSACHLKGSYEVVEKLKKLIGADGRIRVSGSFCCGACGDPRVSVKVNGQLHHVAVEDVEHFYETEIRGKL